MGAFFENLHVRAADREPVLAALRASQALPAFVTTPHQGWVGVFPSVLVEQDFGNVTRLCQAVSAAAKSEVLAFMVHDSSVFCYALSKDGKALDQYNSRPGYFEGAGDAPPSGGNMAALLPLCRAGTKTEDLEKILKQRVVRGRKPPGGVEDRMRQEFEKQIAELRNKYPEMKAQLERMGAPVPSLEEMLRKFDQMGKKIAGAEHESVFAEDGTKALAELLGLPEQWVIAGYEDFRTTRRLPVWAALFNP